MRKILVVLFALFAMAAFASPSISGSSVFTLSRAADGTFGYSDSTTASLAYGSAIKGLPVALALSGGIDVVDSAVSMTAAKVSVSYAPLWLTASVNNSLALAFAPSFDIGGLVAISGSGTVTVPVLFTADPVLAVNAGLDKGAAWIPALSLSFDADMANVMVAVDPLFAVSVSYQLGKEVWLAPYGSASYQLSSAAVDGAVGVKAGFFAGGTFKINYNMVSKVAYASFTFDF